MNQKDAKLLKFKFILLIYLCYDRCVRSKLDEKKLEYYEQNYGVSAQNEALEYIRNLEDVRKK